MCHKIAGIFLLMLISLFSGCTGLDTEMGTVPDPIPPATQITIQSSETPWWGDMPNYRAGVIGPGENLFGIEISGIVKQEMGTDNYDVYNDLQRVKFIHREYGPDDLDTINDILIEQYGVPEKVIFEKLDSNGDSRLDIVAVEYRGGKDSWMKEFNYFKSANIYNYLQAYADPDSNPVLIKK